MYKTFPLQLDKEFHRELKTAAVRSDKTIKDFIIEAVIEKIRREQK